MSAQKPADFESVQDWAEPIPGVVAPKPMAEVAENFIFFLRKQSDGSRWPVGTKLYAELPPSPQAPDGDCLELLAWAYSKLQHGSFSKMDDALQLDRIKLLLEHGITS